MRYRRIHVIGGPGSGKSFIAAKIGSAFGVKVCDLDDLFWNPDVPGYRVRADKEKRDRALAVLVEQDAWVIEGAYYKWLVPGFERADLIIVLNTSVWLRDWRIVKRSVPRLFWRSPSTKKESLGSLFNLLQWNHTYQRNVLNPARALISNLGKSVIECQTLGDVFGVLTGDERSNVYSAGDTNGKRRELR